MSAECVASPKRFLRAFVSQSELQNEYERNISRGRMFLSNAQDAELREVCLIELRRPDGKKHELFAEAVWVGEDGAGIGFEIDRSQRGPALETFARHSIEPPPTTLPSPGVVPPVELDFDDDDDSAPPAAVSIRRRDNVHDRVRALPPQAQQALARQGTHVERVALERCYGGSAWEGLLQNPQITASEVAKIAKKGSLPKPLLNVIVASAAWLSVPEVQRALVGNPRVTGPALTKVLKAMSRRDLARLPQQPGCRMVVRSEAKRLLKSSD